MSERSNQSPERGPWDDYFYNPAPSRPTGDPVRVLSGENNSLTKVGHTPQVGVDGLREALAVRYGSIGNQPVEQLDAPEEE